MNGPAIRPPMCVHGGLGVFFESTAKAVRHAGPIAAASDTLYHTLLDKFFSADSFADLPEVIACPPRCAGEGVWHRR